MTPEEQQDYIARMRKKNVAVALAVVGFVALIFVITLIKQGFFVL